MSEIVLRDLNLFEELDDWKSESVVGGAAEQVGNNLVGGVPFTELYIPGQNGYYQSNYTGFTQSANGHTYGAPAVIHAG